MSKYPATVTSIGYDVFVDVGLQFTGANLRFRIMLVLFRSNSAHVAIKSRGVLQTLALLSFVVQRPG